jgi:hypothetical protein
MNTRDGEMIAEKTVGNERGTKVVVGRGVYQPSVPDT